MGGTGQEPAYLEHRPPPVVSAPPPSTPPSSIVGGLFSNQQPAPPPQQGPAPTFGPGMMPYTPSGVNYNDPYMNKVGDYYQSMFGTQTGLNAGNLMDWYGTPYVSPEIGHFARSLAWTGDSKKDEAPTKEFFNMAKTKGWTNEQIALALGFTPKQIEDHFNKYNLLKPVQPVSDQIGMNDGA
jgi:hypothetical protein